MIDLESYRSACAWLRSEAAAARACWRIITLDRADERRWAREVPNIFDAIMDTWGSSVAFAGAQNAARLHRYEVAAAAARRCRGAKKVERKEPTPKPPMSEPCRRTLDAVAQKLERPRLVKLGGGEA